MKGEFTLCQFNAPSCGSLSIRVAAKRPIDLNQQAQGLIVVRLDFCRTLEKRSCPLELTLREAGTGLRHLLGHEAELRDALTVTLPSCSER